MVVMHVMMVYDRHHVEKSLRNYLEWLWRLMLTSKHYINMLNSFNMGIWSYSVYSISYLIHYRDNELRHILYIYSISLRSKNLPHMAMKLLIFAYPVSNWRRPTEAWQELIFLYAYLHLNRTLVHESQRGRSAQKVPMSHQCNTSPT